MATLHETITSDALEFCAEHGLLDHLRTAIALVRECFPDARALRGDVIADPESDAPWVTLTVEISGSVEDLIARDDCFMQRWNEAVPWPDSDRIVTTLDIT